MDRFSRSTPFQAKVKVTGTLDDTINAMVKQLGAEEYQDRQQAEENLLAYGRFVIPYLEKVRNDPDPEIRWRAKRILKELTE